MSHRATKSGLAAETQAKIKAKYDSTDAEDKLNWVASMIGESINTSGEHDNVAAQLGDGLILCKLANAIKPGSIPAKKLEKAPTMAFKKMELVELAVKAFKSIGISDTETFQSVDLVDQSNIHQVVLCLGAVARKCGHGPKEAKENKREFSDAQMKAGQNVIGLQMGTNKGASQAGMNLGKMRMITNDEKE